jgi:hypothetical protein
MSVSKIKKHVYGCLISTANNLILESEAQSCVHLNLELTYCFSDMFISYVGKFGGELEFGPGLVLTYFCAIEINGRRVSEEVEVSDTLLQNNSI